MKKSSFLQFINFWVIFEVYRKANCYHSTPARVFRWIKHFHPLKNTPVSSHRLFIYFFSFDHTIRTQRCSLGGFKMTDSNLPMLFLKSSKNRENRRWKSSRDYERFSHYLKDMGLEGYPWTDSAIRVGFRDIEIIEIDIEIESF